MKQGVLEVPSVVNAKLMSTEKNKEILAKYLEMVQTHYTEPSSDEDVVMGTFLLMSVNEDANTINCKDCNKCPNNGNYESLKNVTIPSHKPSSDISTFLKEQRIKENKLLQKKKTLYPVMILNQR